VSNKTILWIIAAFALGVGSIGVVGTARQLVRRQRSKSWPVAPGRITHSEMTVETKTSAKGESTMYGARIAYTYAIGGVDHEGHQVDWLDDIKTNFDSPARKLVAKYPVGQVVNVYYDPADPATALLEPWRLRGILFIALFAVVFSGFGVFLVWMAQREP